MLFPRVFFIDRFTGETIRSQKPPDQGASVKLNCHLILPVAAKFCVHSAVNAVPLSDKIIRGQPLRDINFFKLFTNVFAETSGTKSNTSPRVAAHGYRITKHLNN